jgi:uncharacterized protein
VKIDPKAIGVGQYQHDLSSNLKLAPSMRSSRTASTPSALTSTPPPRPAGSGFRAERHLAAGIVAHRDAHGPFPSREALKQVSRLGPKTFEQAAGFLRIQGGENPLDASSVHPEAYPVVERILAATHTPVKSLIGNTDVLRRLDAGKFTDERFGLPTVKDILKELEKPGRDPRPEFKTATFKDGVEDIKDLQPGMTLEGVVSNVANFGAFVDIGVHQDGLVHVSALAHKFVKDPRDVVKAGDIVRVKVLEVDVARQRIALSMRLDDAVQPARADAGRAAVKGKAAAAMRQPEAAAGSLADALAKALRR